MNIFKYTVTYYDAFDNKIRERKGLVCANTFAEAVNELTEYYGESETESLALDYITDGAVVESCEIPDDIKLEG